MTNQPKAPLTYRDAGVDIDAGDALVDRIKPLAARTMRPGVLAGIDFASFWRLKPRADLFKLAPSFYQPHVSPIFLGFSGTPAALPGMSSAKLAAWVFGSSGKA